MHPLVPAVLLSVQAATLFVGPRGQHQTIADALAAAAPGDTVRVAPGVYREHLVVTRPVTLLGEPGAVIDGGGTGVVLSIHARVVISGFTIRGSGDRQAAEHAGILATAADSLVIEGNRLEDVLFGIYLKQCDAPVISGNSIEGKDLPVSLRGDGIRLWYSHGSVIAENTVTRSRDVVIWFADRATVVDNRISDSRYGLHYMYSNHNRFERNAFIHNHVGAFIMYSEDITFRDNVFADARGTTGRGLGFKDADRIVAENNVLVRNAIGISIDNSPHSVGISNRFHGNVIAFNDVGVSLLPSVHSNAFTHNTFLDNVQPVAVTGGGDALANTWRGNYWSGYTGFDADHDGRGDTPFVYERLSDDLFAKHESLRLFNLSLAASALNTLSRVFPLLQPQPIVVDSLPQLERQWDAARTEDAGPAPGRVAGVLIAAVVTAGAALRLRRRARGTA